MPSARTLITATAALAALALPATAAAKPHAGHADQGRGHKVSMLLRGTYSGGDLQVRGGNRAARRAGLVGTSVTLDLSDAKLRVHDRNGDGSRDAEDLQDGDRVVVHVRVARGDEADGTLAVRRLVAHANHEAQGDDGRADDDSQGDDDTQGDDAPETDDPSDD